MHVQNPRQQKNVRYQGLVEFEVQEGRATCINNAVRSKVFLMYTPVARSQIVTAGARLLVGSQWASVCEHTLHLLTTLQLLARCQLALDFGLGTAIKPRHCSCNTSQIDCLHHEHPSASVQQTELSGQLHSSRFE